MSVDLMNEVNPEQYLNNLCNTTIQISPVHGHGLFAAATIPESSCLGGLDGQLVSWANYNEILACFSESSGVRQYFFMEWNCVSTTHLLVRPFRTRYSLINHSRHPNLMLCYDPLRIVSLRDIAVGEELFLDYRKEPLPAEYLEHKDNDYL
jgi:hypothetical protein